VWSDRVISLVHSKVIQTWRIQTTLRLILWARKVHRRIWDKNQQPRACESISESSREAKSEKSTQISTQTGTRAGSIALLRQFSVTAFRKYVTRCSQRTDRDCFKYAKIVLKLEDRINARSGVPNFASLSRCSVGSGYQECSMIGGAPLPFR